MQCLNCGSEIDIEERYAHFFVCPYCRSATVLDEKAARLSGSMAVLAPGRGPLYVGAGGEVEGRRFNVLGRVRYGYGEGYWDEWYLILDDGGAAWISEDENDFTFEELIKVSTLENRSPSPGDTMVVAGATWYVDEIGVAVCEGGEGQLPFPVAAGEEIPFWDLTGNDGAFATIELEEDGARLFRGRHVDRASFRVDTERPDRPDTLDAESSARGGERERVVKKAGRSLVIGCEHCGDNLGIPEPGASHLTCKSCGGEIDLDVERLACPQCGVASPIRGGEDAATLTCVGCHAHLARTREKVEVLAILVDEDRPKIPFKIGQPCRFEGEDYHLIGHVRYQEKWGHETYDSDEFLLYSTNVGYAWLTVENRHFSLGRTITDRPEVDVKNFKRRRSFAFRGRSFRMFEKGRSTIVWVDGELTWVARVGDKIGYMDSTSPPYLLSAELTEREIEWTVARYIGREAVAEAFAMPVNRFPEPGTVAPHQVFEQSALKRRSAWIVMGLFFVALGFMADALSRQDSVATELTVSYDQYREEFITEAFEIRKSDVVCMARFKAPVNNSWVYFDGAVLNDGGGVLHDFSAEMSYYHGVEGGESWSEGSRKDDVLFKIEEPGEYSFLVQGQAGRGNSDVPQPGGETVTVTVYEGVRLARYYIIVMVLAAVWMLGVWLPRAIFEGRRWKEDDQ